MNNGKRWFVLTSTNVREISDFLRRNEPLSTVISEKYRSGALDRRLRRGGRFYVLSGHAAIYHGPGGFFYPIGIAPRVPYPESLTRATGNAFKRYSIMGKTADVVALTEWIGDSVAVQIDYLLLRRSARRPIFHSQRPDPAIRIEKPRPEEWKRLLPLQIAYEVEEVLLPGRKANPAVSKATLTESLATQKVLVAYYNGSVIGRVATNAIGYTTAQIGGVYTDPMWRGRGVARLLMTHLLRELRDEGRDASLFVKPENSAAMRLYQGLDFSFETDFRISYYS